MRLKRVIRVGSDRKREGVGVAEGRIGRKGVMEDAKETEVAGRGTAAGRDGGRESRRAREGGIRGILSRAAGLLETKNGKCLETRTRAE